MLKIYRRLELDDEVTSLTHPLYLVPLGLESCRVYITVPPGYHEVFWVNAGESACVINRDMAADVARLYAHGVNRLVTLMPGQEILDSGMGGLEIELNAYGIQWTHLPILEGELYDEFFERELVRFSKEMQSAILAGERIAIHSDGWASRLDSHLPKLLIAIDSSLTMDAAKQMVTVGLCYAKSVYR